MTATERLETAIAQRVRAERRLDDATRQLERAVIAVKYAKHEEDEARGQYFVVAPMLDEDEDDRSSVLVS